MWESDLKMTRFILFLCVLLYSSRAPSTMEAKSSRDVTSAYKRFSCKQSSAGRSQTHTQYHMPVTSTVAHTLNLYVLLVLFISNTIQIKPLIMHTIYTQVRVRTCKTRRCKHVFRCVVQYSQIVRGGKCVSLSFHSHCRAACSPRTSSSSCRPLWG